jgi:hypothetical protein
MPMMAEGEAFAGRPDDPTAPDDAYGNAARLRATPDELTGRVPLNP